MDISQINLNLLRVFDAVLAEGNVTRAAARLRLTQSATSSALTRLRLAINDPLFIRTAQGMRPTPKAAAIAEPIRRALEEVSRALGLSVSFEPALSQQIFRIASTDHIWFVLLPLLAPALAREAPQTTLDLMALGPQHTGDSAQLDELDMLIAPFVGKASPNLKPPANFRMRKLFTERVVVLARDGHPRIKSQLTLQAFAKAEHVLIAPRGGWLTGPVDQMLAKAGLKRSIRMAVPHYMIVPSIIAATDLMVTMPERVARAFVGSLPVRIHPLPIEIPDYAVSMAWHDRHHLDSAHQWLRNQLVELCRAL